MRSGIPLHADDLFRCTALACTLRGRVCIARMLEAEKEIRRRSDPDRPWELKRHDAKRGVGAEFPHCLRCCQGRAIRAALGDECAAEVREGSRDGGLVAVLAAERERVYGEPPTIDSHLGER